MMNCFFLDTQRCVIDLHSMRIWEAIILLNEMIETVDRDIKEIKVIHGYHNGTRLRDVLRNDYSNPAVVRKFVGMNEGVTYLIIDKEGKYGRERYKDKQNIL